MMGGESSLTRSSILLVLLATLFVAVYPKCITLGKTDSTANFFEKFNGTKNDSERLQYYSYIYYRSESGDKTLFLGSSDTVYKVDPDTFTQEWELNLPLISSGGLTCRDLTNPVDVPFQCRNHISVIERISSSWWLVCGTNAKNPLCWKCMESVRGDGDQRAWNCSSANIANVDHFIPESPNYDSTWLYDANMSVSFAGTQVPSHNLGFFKKLDAADDFSTVLKNDENRPNWLNVPAYVGDPIKYNRYIYYFFRETATEYMNAGKILYSRVGRVCADNEAASSPFPGVFQTMVKARLNCSIDLRFPFYFNEIQDTFVTKRDDNDQIIYAVFTTPGSGPPASAVCAYSLKEIENLFNNLAKYKGQEQYGDDWLPKSHERLGSSEPFGQCGVSYTSQEQINGVSKYSLVDQLVPNLRNVRQTGLGQETSIRESDSPILYLNNYRFTSIAKVANDSNGGPIVLMIGTDNKRILKAAFYPDMARNKYGYKIAEIKLTETIDPNVVNEVRDIVVHEQGVDTYIIATAVSDAFKVNVEFCSTYETCEDCRRVMDPHCYWNNTANKCKSDGTLRSEPESVDECKVYVGSSEYDVVKSFQKNQSLSDKGHPVNDYSLVVAKKGSKLGLVAASNGNWSYNLSYGATPETEFYAIRVAGISNAVNDLSMNFIVTLDDEERGTLNVGLYRDSTVVAQTEQAKKIYSYDCELAVYEYNMTRVRQNMLKNCAEGKNAGGVFQCPSARFQNDHDSYTCPAD